MGVAINECRKKITTCVCAKNREILYIACAATRDTVAEAHRAHTNSVLWASWGPFSRRPILIYQFGFPTDQSFFYSARVAVSTFQSLCYLLVLLLSLFISSFRFFHPFLSFPCLSLLFFLFLHVLCFASTAKQDIYIFLFFFNNYILLPTFTFKFLVMFWF